MAVAADLQATIARAKRKDVLFVCLGVAALLFAACTFVALFLDMVSDGWSRLNGSFFTEFASRRPERAGILAAWVGSFVVMLVTAFVAVPVGVSAGIYLEEYAPRNRMTALIEININNLAGVPSIVYGLLALGLFVHTFGLGASVLTAGLTLALLILPVVIVATREAIRAVPGAIREAAYALGATRWQMVKDHVLPYSMPGILTGTIIGLAQALGETAPLLLIGMVGYIASDAPGSIAEGFMSPNSAMPAQIYEWAKRADPAYYERAWGGIIILLIFLMAMNIIAVILRRRFERRW